MSFNVQFFFHGNLNDFLPKRIKHHWVTSAFKNTTSVKDAIEACGVPHVEIERIHINEIQQPFSTLLQANDKVAVFSYENALPPDAPHSFVLDVHLGKLARLLRMMGIDALYENNWQDREIASVSASENRVVLTRDIGLLKHKVLRWGYWLRSQQPEEQLREVVQRFRLCQHLQPFSRCLACNGLLVAVEKGSVADKLPPLTRVSFDAFFQCTDCRKVYWKGSHWEHMQERAARIRSLACD